MVNVIWYLWSRLSSTYVQCYLVSTVNVTWFIVIVDLEFVLYGVVGNRKPAVQTDVDARLLVRLHL